MIYFIQAAETEMVKIGFTDSHETLKVRIKVLQTGSPYELRVIGTVAGDIGTEKLLHALFHNDHERGEWFKLTDEQIYTLSQFECELRPATDNPQVIDFTKDNEFMAVHDELIQRIRK